VAVVATATIAPLANVQSLGNPILEQQTYGAAGTLGAAILVALITLAVDGVLALAQRLLTPKGLTVATRSSAPRRSFFTVPARTRTET
jgi:osmoprotectant transport system permease protein